MSLHNMQRSKDKIPFNCGETGSTGGCLPPPCLLTSPSSSVGELGVVWEGLTVGVGGAACKDSAYTRPAASPVACQGSPWSGLVWVNSQVREGTS